MPLLSGPLEEMALTAALRRARSRGCSPPRRCHLPPGHSPGFLFVLPRIPTSLLVGPIQSGLKQLHTLERAIAFIFKRYQTLNLGFLLTNSPLDVIAQLFLQFAHHSFQFFELNL